MITTLLYGCGGSSTGSANDTSKEKETASTETTQTPVQEETGEAVTPAQEETATPPAEAEETTGKPTGFIISRITESMINTGSTNIINYDQSGDVISSIGNNDENKYYSVMVVDKQYDEDGKWVSSTIYSANQDTAIDPANTDIFKTEENKEATETCSYDDSGLVVERSDSSGTVTQIDTYNENHQKIQSQFGVNRESPTIVNRKYDEQGVLIEEEIENNGAVTVYKYTPIGVTHFLTSCIMNDETLWEAEINYDENGLPTGGTFSDYNSGESTEFSFELDEYGNLIHRETKNGDSVVNIADYEILPIYE